MTALASPITAWTTAETPLDKADRCRRLARLATDARTIAVLKALAAEYEGGQHRAPRRRAR